MRMAELPLLNPLILWNQMLQHDCIDKGVCLGGFCHQGWRMEDENRDIAFLYAIPTCAG